MEFNIETITVLAITNTYNDQVELVGVSDGQEWIRLINLSSQYLSLDGRIPKAFNRIKLYCRNHKTKDKRREDRIFVNKKIDSFQLINKLNLNEQRIILKKYLDNSLTEIIYNYRTIGLIKPVINRIEFGWNTYSCKYEFRLHFKDCYGQEWDLLCKDPAWRNYWIDLFRREPTKLRNRLSRIRRTLNDNDTYFVVGFTRRFNEIPGPFDGRWPLVLGIHTYNF